jgi:hypothetical protein
MQAMNASYFLERVGAAFLNAALLAALPTAAIAILVQAI